VTLFIIFGALALGAGIGMVVQRNAVHAALLLVVNLFATAVLFLTLGAEFLFVAEIIVYAGAIMVLFLFVIMLLGVDRAEPVMEPRRFQARQLLAGGVVAALLVAGLFTSLVTRDVAAPLQPTGADFGTARALGDLLFHSYLLPFELTSLLLLVAAIGILMLAKRTPT
jgi:NADH-quinone oxidoreductase subunit J